MKQIATEPKNGPNQKEVDEMTDGPSIQSKSPLAVKIVVGFLVVWFVLLMAMQATSVIDFGFAYSLGFQEDDPASLDRFVAGRAYVEQGTALADVFVQGLLLLGAVVGLLMRRAFGLACAFGELAITVYWPTFDILQESYLTAHGYAEGLVIGAVLAEIAIVAVAVASAVTLYRYRKLFLT